MVDIKAPTPEQEKVVKDAMKNKPVQKGHVVGKSAKYHYKNSAMAKEAFIKTDNEFIKKNMPYMTAKNMEEREKIAKEKDDGKGCWQMIVDEWHSCKALDDKIAFFILTLPLTFIVTMFGVIITIIGMPFSIFKHVVMHGDK